MSHEDTSLTLVERGNAIAISTVADYQMAAEVLKGATGLQRKIQVHYAPLKQVSNLLHKNIIEAETGQIKPLQLMIERVKGLMLGWQNEQKQIAEKQQADLQAAANKKWKAGALVPQMQVSAEIPKVEGVSGRSTWKAVIVDVDQIPYEYLIPDQAALDAAARRMKEAFNIPGARAVHDQNVIVKGV